MWARMRGDNQAPGLVLPSEPQDLRVWRGQSWELWSYDANRGSLLAPPTSSPDSFFFFNSKPRLLNRIKLSIIHWDDKRLGRGGVGGMEGPGLERGRNEGNAIGLGHRIHRPGVRAQRIWSGHVPVRNVLGTHSSPCLSSKGEHLIGWAPWRTRV